MALNDGLTLMHEHMSIALSPEDVGTEAFDMQCRDLEDAYRYGVRNVVDLTNQTMGRSPEHVRRLTEATGMNIIMCTGYYFEELIDPAVMDRTPEDIAEEAVRELTEGIADSGMKAGIIGEIAWSLDGPYEKELKTWEGMCIAARRTGAAVSTHSSRGIQQIPQAEYLKARGIPPEKIVIGHSDFCKDDERLKKLFRTGVFVGLDMIGKDYGDGDEFRADRVRKIKEWGFLDRLLLSMDICRTKDLRSAGGYGYAHLFEKFIPMLERRGITEGEIELMLKNNPEKVFESKRISVSSAISNSILP